MRFFILAATLATALSAAEPGFTSLFNGTNLDGWKLVGGRGPGYVVKDGIIVCPPDGGGNRRIESRCGASLTSATRRRIGGQCQRTISRRKWE